MLASMLSGRSGHVVSHCQAWQSSATVWNQTLFLFFVFSFVFLIDWQLLDWQLQPIVSNRAFWGWGWRCEGFKKFFYVLLVLMVLKMMVYFLSFTLCVVRNVDVFVVLIMMKMEEEEEEEEEEDDDDRILLLNYIPHVCSGLWKMLLTRAHIHVRTHAQHARSHTRVLTHTRARTYTHTHTHTHTLTHARTHARTHTPTYTLSPFLKLTNLTEFESLLDAQRSHTITAPHTPAVQLQQHHHPSPHPYHPHSPPLPPTPHPTHTPHPAAPSTRINWNMNGERNR